MTPLEEKLVRWTKPSSDSEQEKQDRTERMIREAIDAHDAFEGMTRKVYAKGSYANNTNIRADSDVDIAVECNEAFYWDEQTPNSKPPGNSYVGEWSPAKLRAELIAALKAKFGSDVDTSGLTAIQIHSSTARVEADVVPCFGYRYYFSDGDYRKGAKVFKTNDDSVVNYSTLQLENGRAKNTLTNGAFKKAVRILKRLENEMVDAGQHREVPSFFVECLVYNCPDSIFTRSSWTEVVSGIITHVYNSLEGDEPSEGGARWVEVNRAKFLFSGKQKWTRKDGRDFALAGWNHLGLGDG